MKQLKEFIKNCYGKKFVFVCHGDGSYWSYVASMDEAAKRISEESGYSIEDVLEEFMKSEEDHSCGCFKYRLDGEQWGVTVIELTEHI